MDDIMKGRIDLTPLPDRCLCVKNIWFSDEFIMGHRKTKKNLARGYPYELEMRLDMPLYRCGVEYEYKYSRYGTLKGDRVYIFMKGCFLGGMSELEFKSCFVLT
jgi:hypothetical protein